MSFLTIISEERMRYCILGWIEICLTQIGRLFSKFNEVDDNFNKGVICDCESFVEILEKRYADTASAKTEDLH